MKIQQSFLRFSELRPLLIKESRRNRKKAKLMECFRCSRRKNQRKTNLGRHDFKTTLKPVSSAQSSSVPKGFYAVSRYSVETLSTDGATVGGGERKVLVLEGPSQKKNVNSDDLEVRIDQSEDVLLDHEDLTGKKKKRNKCSIM